MLRLLYLYFILHIQYSFFEASPLVGEDVEMANLEDFPFIVSIGHKICGNVDNNVIIRSQFCGGSLITARHVLTAEHCLTNKQPKNTVVKIGSIDVVNGHTYAIKWWLTYTQWINDRAGYSLHGSNIYMTGRDGEDIHDIAIIKIRESASHIKLPTISYTPETYLYNKSAVTGGWGVIEGNKKPRYMRIAKFIIKSPNNCEPFIMEQNPLLRNVLPQYRLCTTSARGTTTTCGDSGSPLLRDDNNIVGVNIQYCMPGNMAPLIAYRNMHSSVNAYRGFIEDVKTK